jgi:rhodanese-related sulfurtransferase
MRKILFTLLLLLPSTYLAASETPGSPPPAAAPPPKAAVTTMAAIAEGVASIDHAALQARIERQDQDLLVLDVRTAEEFAAGHVPRARNISHDLLPSRVAELDDARQREVVVYCRSGRRSALALETLRAAGFTRLAHLEGDFLGWQAAQRPIETTAAPAPAASTP